MYQESTLTQIQHKQPKEPYMKTLAKKIATLKKADYDKKIYSAKEIGEKTNPETFRDLQLCEAFGIDVTIIVSELIHSRDELAELKSKTLSFREQGNLDAKATELQELIAELETVLLEKTHQASKMKSFKAREEAHAKSVAALEPLALELKEIEKKIKDAATDIRVVEGNRNIFDNTINPDIFRLMNVMSSPAGVFA